MISRKMKNALKMPFPYDNTTQIKRFSQSKAPSAHIDRIKKTPDSIETSHDQIKLAFVAGGVVGCSQDLSPSSSSGTGGIGIFRRSPRSRIVGRDSLEAVEGLRCQFLILLRDVSGNSTIS